MGVSNCRYAEILPTMGHWLQILIQPFFSKILPAILLAPVTVPFINWLTVLLVVFWKRTVELIFAASAPLLVKSRHTCNWKPPLIVKVAPGEISIFLQTA